MNFVLSVRAKKYQWLGLGRSYGPKATPQNDSNGAPEMTEDLSPEDNWLLENTHFFEAILGKTDINGGYKDALNSLKIVEDIYGSSRKLQEEYQSSCPHPQWWQNS